MKLGYQEINLVVPYTDLNTHTEAFADRHGATKIRLTTDYSYYNLILNYWSQDKPFIVLEHDIVPTEGDYQEIVHCHRDWCVFQYDSLGTAVAMLGFAKFDPRGMRRATLAVIDVKWDQVDTMLWGALQAVGYAPHIHGWVKHLRRPRGREAYNFDTVFPDGAIRSEIWWAHARLSGDVGVQDATAEVDQRR